MSDSCRHLAWGGVIVLLLFTLGSSEALATPEFGRRYQVKSCNVCHTVVPKLNARGWDFLARGYQPDPRLGQEPVSTVPFRLWLAGRLDNRISDDFTKTFFGKAELVAGGPLDENGSSYFLEWRLLSLETQSDGSLKDRTGRFEDLFVNWQLDPRWTLTVGQYRPLQQLEPGRKLSISTPALFDTKLAGDNTRNKRLKSLSAFSTGSRSPSISLNYQSFPGELASDGLFHTVTVASPGEFSLPLTRDARTNASFEFDGTPKGVVFETYYREKLNSIGAHAFVGRNGNLLIAGVGQLNVDDLYATAGIGFDNQDGEPPRVRSSLELEYLPTMDDYTWRPGFGFRVEDVSNDGRATSYIPYLVLAAPNNADLTTLLQLEYRGQKDHERLRLDFSIIF